MSKYLSAKLSALEPYVPGEQPQDKEYIKLNTNESPFPPSQAVKAAVEAELARLNLYPDPEAHTLRDAIAKRYGVDSSRVMCTNGSDEALGFAFQAFCDNERGAAFADVTYGFYPVFCGLFGITPRIVPLESNFRLCVDAYTDLKETAFIANPNAQTGLFVPVAEIERIVASNPEKIVVIDEAYIDFGGESAARLTLDYPNIVVIGTFSKSRSLAGGRIGFAIADPALISDLNTVRYSFHPYSVNRLSLAAGIAAMNDEAYFAECTAKIIAVRETVKQKLTERGFGVTDSLGNFLLASHPSVDGKTLYLALREMGVLVRIFPDERIKNHIRITVGTAKQMERLTDCIDSILANL